MADLGSSAAVTQWLIAAASVNRILWRLDPPPPPRRDPCLANIGAYAASLHERSKCIFFPPHHMAQIWPNSGSMSHTSGQLRSKAANIARRPTDFELFRPKVSEVSSMSAQH